MKDTAFDLILAGGDLIDGTGLPRWKADVGIIDDRIVAVGDLSGVRAAQRLDATGLIVCPGFIDVHTHDDRALISDPEMTPKVSQGVTTVVVGNCGVSLAPLRLVGTPPPPLDALGGPEWYRYSSFKEYLNDVKAARPATNALCLVGHGSLRVGCVKALDRPANEEEQAQMEALLIEALEAGAAGISSGLFYPPSEAAPAAEVVKLAAIVASYGGIYTAHIRDEADSVTEALDEAFAIAREAGVPLILSHHKVAGKQNFGRTQSTIPQIALARTRQSIGVDVYPYAASSTMLNLKSWRASKKTLVTWCQPMPSAAGRDLADVAKELGITEEEAITVLQPAGGIFFMMDELDVQRVLQFPEAMIGSDGLPHDPMPHPRLWGSFTRVLGHYVRVLGLLSLEDAIRRMTALPASQFKIENRGVIASGAFADIVVFDAKKVLDSASFESPKVASDGINHVFVNGVPVWGSGHATGNRSGRILKRS